MAKAYGSFPRFPDFLFYFVKKKDDGNLHRCFPASLTKSDDRNEILVSIPKKTRHFT